MIYLGSRLSPVGEEQRFFVQGEDVLVERRNGQRHYYCPVWFWPISITVAEKKPMKGVDVED